MAYREDTRICHSCKGVMARLDKNNVHVDHCATCKHTFFDAGEMAQVTNRSAALESKIEEYSNPQLHCDSCQVSILEENDCKNPPARCCASCGAALFIVYATPCDLEFCRKCKGIIVRDDALQQAIEKKLELSRVQIFSEAQIADRQHREKQPEPELTTTQKTVGIVELGLGLASLFF